MKKLYKSYEYWLQKWIYVRAYSLEQAKRLFRNRAKSMNGKWRYDEGVYEYTDKNNTIFHAIKF